MVMVVVILLLLLTVTLVITRKKVPSFTRVKELRKKRGEGDG